jgi:predicted hotdog family 3-hydroxylacyl-ACP dehydratase
MLIEKSNIKKYIPQREPFIMVDSLVSADETGFLSNFEVDSNNVLLDKEVLSESALAENIAQTCAAGFGYLASLEEEGEAKLGFIGAITKMEVIAEVGANTKVETRVNILNTFETIHLVEGVASANGKEIVKCQMKIVLA